MNHRRPSHDELTPEDLFRPEPAQGTTIPGEVVRSSEMPWNSPAQQQPEYFGEAPQPTQPFQQPPLQQPPLQQPYGQPYEQQPYEQQPSYEAPAYGQQPYAPPADEASTQFLPPFPAGPQPQAQPQSQAQPPSYGGYPQPQTQPQTQMQPQPGYGYQPPASPPPAPGGRSGARFSPRAIGIAVVAGCAVVGIGIAAALSGGGGGSAAAAGTHGPSASGSSKSTADARTGSSVDQGQAKAMSDLLATASNSRSAVISAVGSIQHCQNLDQAAQDLTTAAGLRGQLIQQLAALQTDKLPDGGALATALQQGWKASQSADTHYAAWAKASKSSCDHKHTPKDGAEKQAGAAASSDATVAKQKASRLWDAIAGPAGLPKRASTQL